MRVRQRDETAPDVVEFEVRIRRTGDHDLTTRWEWTATDEQGRSHGWYAAWRWTALLAARRWCRAEARQRMRGGRGGVEVWDYRAERSPR